MEALDLYFRPESPYPNDTQNYPARSYLYALPPHGVGTPLVESVLSYVNRLAAAYCVSPRRLIRDQFSKACPDLARYKRSSEFFFKNARSANGVDRYSEYFAQTIEALCRVDVRGLTLQPLAALLPFNGPGLFAPHPRWCPACYAEMRLAGLEVFQPLVWFLDACRVCYKHRCELQDRCPACSSLQCVIPQIPLMGFCENCRTWLGRQNTTESTVDQFELWCAIALGDIAASLPKIQGLATRERFANHVQQAVTAFAGGSRRRFCLEIGLTESALQFLLSGDKRPTLSLWLEIAYGIGVSPPVLLECNFTDRVREPLLHTLPRKIRNRAKKRYLSEEQKQALEKQLHSMANDTTETVSVLELAKRLKVSRSCLRHFWPELCSQISAKYQAQLKAAAKERLARQCQKLKEIMDTLLARGIYPSQKSMNKGLAGTEASLLDPTVRALYRQRLAALKKW